MKERQSCRSFSMQSAHQLMLSMRYAFWLFSQLEHKIPLLCHGLQEARRKGSLFFGLHDWLNLMG